MALFAGVDVGSSATKAVVVDADLQVKGKGLHHSGADFSGAARAAFEEALRESGANRDEVDKVVSTGYGRTNVDFADDRRTEIDCHARGAYHYFPRAITVVDIGGQDNKVIQLDLQGRRQTFSMNRKCAAGTGSFLEEMALRLKIPIGDLSSLAEKSTDSRVSIGSFCTVFAMTEILGKIREGVRPEDLARAALVSVAKRVLETQVMTHDVVATGGVVAHNPVMKGILARILNTQVYIPPHPQHIGAFGAALVAAGSVNSH
jgi:(R)-2-hydroxyacyl-CoA dehydratese activating ATPase